MEKVYIQISKELYTKTILDIMKVLRRHEREIKQLKKAIKTNQLVRYDTIKD